jgi:hypothetical protein
LALSESEFDEQKFGHEPTLARIDERTFGHERKELLPPPKEPGRLRRFVLNRFVIMLFGGFIGLIIGMMAASYKPLPIPDRGHRLFAVKDEKAHDVVLKLLNSEGLQPFKALETAPVHQTLLSDMRTVVAWFDADKQPPEDAISIAVDDPMITATQWAIVLRKAGFTADISEPIPGQKGVLVRLKTDALVHSVFVFRLFFLKMPDTPDRPLPKFD